MLLRRASLLTHSAFDVYGSAPFSAAAGSRVATSVATDSAFSISSDALPELNDRAFYRKAHENLRKTMDGICATVKLPEEIAWFELSERELQKKRSAQFDEFLMAFVGAKSAVEWRPYLKKISDFLPHLRIDEKVNLLKVCVEKNVGDGAIAKQIVESIRSECGSHDQWKNCWFCLANVRFATHLIIAVGRTCYAEVPRGPLTDDHLTILPIQHVSSLVEANEEIRAEVARFRDTFAAMAYADGNRLCTFERNFETSHFQLHCVPVSRKVKAESIADVFARTAERRHVALQVLSDDVQLTDVITPGLPYFYAELPNNKRLFARCEPSFFIHFGREALCEPDVLNEPHRVDWRKCVLTSKEERRSALKLRKKFAPFDFTTKKRQAQEPEERQQTSQPQQQEE